MFYVLNYKELNDIYLILWMMTWEFGIWYIFISILLYTDIFITFFNTF